MAMISLIPLILLAILFFLCPTYCWNQKQPSDHTFRDLVVAEKTRLGSTPPSCHSKCNQCHPCMAVQVPTIPSHNQVQLISTSPASSDYLENSLSSSAAGNRYSNYKPLGWKCRCDGHLYNP